MNREELISAYSAFLRRYQWQVYGTLTFATMPSISIANRIFSRWIAEVPFGCPSLQNRWPPERSNSRDLLFRWFRVTERGKFGNHLHFHILLGGLQFPSLYLPLLLWQDIGGDAVLSYFNANDRGLDYMLKTARPGQNFEIEFQLPDARTE